MQWIVNAIGSHNNCLLAGLDQRTKVWSDWQGVVWSHQYNFWARQWRTVLLCPKNLRL